MLRWRTLVAFVVLALWMPATSHCALEAAGVLEAGKCCDGEGEDSHTVADNCAPIERELGNPSSGNVAVSAPILFFAYVLVQPALPAGVQTASHVPPVADFSADDWLRTWNFERRTALPTRAPAVNV